MSRPPPKTPAPTSSTSTSFSFSSPNTTEATAQINNLLQQPPHPLITQTLVETKKYYCPYLQRGDCRKSSKCNFSHDSQTSTRIPIDYCHFFLSNQCLYGQECKFTHSEPPERTDAGRVEPVAADLEDQVASEAPPPPPAIDNSQQLANISGGSGAPASSRAWQGKKLFSTAASQNCTATSTTASGGGSSSSTATAAAALERNYPLCPYSLESGECPFPVGRCGYLHGLVCDLCCRQCLHPFNETQRRQHRDECVREHEREMELSFAIQRSRDKVCGICMDTVVDKKPITSSRFGILVKCNHIFCLDCIRKWRGTKQFDSRTIRACPECRVSSDFVVPSKYWVEDQDDKDKLIQDYKAAMRSKPCRHFDEGRGECPFASSCFYKHAYSDGRLAVMDPPKQRRRLYGARGPTTTSVANYILWNILAATGDDQSDDEPESLYLDPYYATDEDYDDFDPDDLDHGEIVYL